ncbi:MAG: SMP-30/gluconolactonase/LRE family protein [Nitrospinota bacterium]
MRGVILLFCLSVLALAAPAFAFEVSALSVPESFIVDDETGSYYISNINGRPTEKNNSGFITKLSPDGTVVEKKFVQGGKNGVTLHAPKGLLITGDTLYVTDIDHVRGFDKKTGGQKVSIDLRSFKPKFLNDLAQDYFGMIYVTDMGTNRIFNIDPANGNKADVFASGPELASPNGISFSAVQRKLIFANAGTGELYWLDEHGKPLKFETKKKLDTGLDGIDFDLEGNIYVSTFTGGKIYRIGRQGDVKQFVTDLITPADISLDTANRLILVPSFSGNRAFTLAY